MLIQGLNRVEALSKKKNISMAQVALAWCLSKDPVSAPIIGTTNLSNLEDLVGELERFGCIIRTTITNWHCAYL